MGVGEPRDVAATNGHIAWSSVPSRVGERVGLIPT